MSQLWACIHLSRDAGKKSEECVSMRSFAIMMLSLIGFCGLNVAALAQTSCKVCSEQQAACMKNYAGPTCKSEYKMCMKSCGKRS